MQDTTKAIVFEKYGGPLKTGTLSLPPLTSNQVLVRVYSVSLNPIDYKRRDGYAKGFIKDEFPAGICYDVSGVVEKVASDVQGFAPGDRICGRSLDAGTLAEYCVLSTSVATKVPEKVSFNEAAALPLASMTAYQSLGRAGLKEGQSIFIAGGSGGVGTFAVQLAKKVFKAGRVVASCSGKNADFVKSLGADEIVDYKKGNPYQAAAANGPFDVVFDTVGDAAQMGGSLIKSGSPVISIAAWPQADSFDRINYPIPFWFRMVLHGASTWNTLRAWPGKYDYVFSHPTSEDLTKLMNFVNDGTLVIHIDSTFEGLGKATEAFEKLESGHAKGKVVVEVRSQQVQT